MSNKKGDSSASADLLGFLLFGVGAVTSVVVAGALIFGLPEKEPDVMGRIAQTVIDFGGAAPSLLFGVAMMTLGARVFLNGPLPSLAQHLSGVLGVSVGLAVLLGAFSPTMGGAVGDNTGGMVARNLTLVPGVLFGLATLALAVWMAWLRDSGLMSLSRNSYPAMREASEEQAVGVSAAEARALLPEEEEEEEEEEDEEPAVSAMDATAASIEARPAWALQNEAPHPYPEDVRREGRIPAGARPLGEPETGHATHIDDAAEDEDHEPYGALQRWAPAHLADAGDAADEDLAAAAADDDFEDELGEPRPLPVQPVAADAGADELDEPELSAAEPRALATPLFTPEAEAKHGLKIIRPSAIAPPRPSWETDDEDEDVPVAAALAAEAAPAEAAASAEAAAKVAESEDQDDAASLETLAALGDDEEWEEVEEEEWEFVEVDEDDPEALAEGEEWEYVEVEVDDEEEEEAESVLGASATDDEDDEDEDEDAEELEDELVAEEEEYEEDEELEEEPVAAYAEDEAEEDEDAELVAVVDEEDVELTPAAAARAGERQMDLFAEPEELVAAADDAAEALEDEPVVVLQPQPALQASDLALRAARMILEEDRVAVSMLQKAFSMDFKASCIVLDELQDLGLIGPYVDGRSRAILMSREEWLTAVGES